MTRSSTATVLSRAGDRDKVDEDKKKVRDYVMNDLFNRVVFVWNDKELEEGGVLHSDFLKNCRPKLADGDLVRASDKDAEGYLNLLWIFLVNEKRYKEWLNLKRSNVYQCMRDKFQSTSSMACV